MASGKDGEEGAVVVSAGVMEGVDRRERRDRWVGGEGTRYWEYEVEMVVGGAQRAGRCGIGNLAKREKFLV